VMLDSGSFGNIKICWYSAVKTIGITSLGGPTEWDR
jgi:hypothetical protein